MNIPDDLIIQILLAGNALLLGLATIAMLRFRRQARRFERFWDSPTGLALADSPAAEPVTKIATDPRLEKRVAELQSVVKTLAGRQPAAQQPAVPDKLPIENAVRMAKHGATIDDLIRNCGLNIGEAQLMRKLHGQTRSSTAIN